MRVTRTAVSLLLLILGGAALSHAEQADLLTGLQSPVWTVRAKSVELIAKTPSLLSSAEVRTALVTVEDLENSVIHNNFRAGTGVSETLGEAYSEYYSGPLCDVLMRLAAEGDMNAARALARGSFNPDSRLALTLATYGEPLVPTLLQQARSDIGPDRWSGVAVLGQMLGLHRTGQLQALLQNTTVDQIKQIVREAAVGDSDTVGRRWAVRALAVAGDKGSLSILQSIAATDPDDGHGQKSTTDYSVRAEARRAIAQINAIR